MQRCSCMSSCWMAWNWLGKGWAVSMHTVLVSWQAVHLLSFNIGFALLPTALPMFRSEGRLYMGWLAQQLAAAGGQRLAQRVQAIEELAEHDVVVNCTGGGRARGLA